MKLDVPVPVRPLSIVLAALGTGVLAVACGDELPPGPEDAGSGPPPAGPNDRIFVDGHFSDWSALDPRHVDPAGDAENDALDLGRLWISQDERFLYLRFELDRAVNLQEDNELTLHLDTDGDDATGRAISGLGADLS